jgi:AcrR family transcriptional regulator
MSENSPPPPRDARVRRSRERLGDALVELIHEKAFDAITVQDVLDRAGVSRSTFYAHYRDKEDLFLSDVDEFFGLMSMALVPAGDRSRRLLPVRELLEHVAGQRAFVEALAEAGRLEGVLDLGRAHFARGIERRLEAFHEGRGIAPATRALCAQALAGALVTLLIAWLRAPARVPPASVDALFQRLAWAGLEGVPPT